MGGLQYIPPYMGTVPYLDFLPGQPSPDWKEGRVFYDDANKTIAVYNSEADITLQLGQEQYIRVKNTLPGTVTNGTLIYVSGTEDDFPTMGLAKSDDPSTTTVIAMATHDIETNTTGFCTTFGLVRDVNTENYAVGISVYVSDTVAGEFTNVVPLAPHFPIVVGTVLKQSAAEGIVLVTLGPTDVAQTMVIQDLEINEDLRVDKKFTLNPSEATEITADGGITITNATMRIKGAGGPVEVTANPQIAPVGTDGTVVFLHGDDDVNTVTIHDGDGLHLHSGSKLIFGQHDHMMLQYDATSNLWEEVSTNFKSFDTSWSFVSPMGDFGTYYIGGYYLFGGTSYTPAGGTSLGSANAAYGAHAFIVLGASSTDMVVRVTGTSIDEQGGRITSDFQDIDTSGGVLDDYFETSKKWIGQVTVSLQSGTGVAVNDGLCKYWDNQNSDFRITGIEVTGRAGANDSAPNFEVIRHSPVGWTFVAGNSALPPAPVVDMQTDYNTEYQFRNNEEFAWKRIGLSEEITGSGSEGLICRVTTTSNKSIETMNWTFSIRPS